MKVLLWAFSDSSAGCRRSAPTRISPGCMPCCPFAEPRNVRQRRRLRRGQSPRWTRWFFRWSARSSWASRVSLAHALIGWTKGTGLMGHNDAIVDAVEEAGVTTTTAEMAAMLLTQCAPSTRRPPLPSGRSRWTSPAAWVSRWTMAALAAEAARKCSPKVLQPKRIRPMRAPSRRCRRRRHPRTIPGRFRVGRPRRRPADLVVIVGGAELGPVRLVADPVRDGGRQRTVGRRRLEAGLDHRAGEMGAGSQAGLVRQRLGRSGRRVGDRGALSRRRDRALRHRESSTTAPWMRRAAPLLVSVFLDKISASWCVQRGRRGRSWKFDRSTPSSGRFQSRATGRSSARPAPRFWVPRRVKLSWIVGGFHWFRSDGVGHQPGHGDSIDRLCVVEPGGHR